MHSRIRLLVSILAAAATGGAASQDPPPSGDPDPALGQTPVAFQADTKEVKLIPWPMRGNIGTGHNILGPSSRIVASSPELLPLAGLLSAEIVRIAQVPIPVTRDPATASDIHLRINTELDFADDPYLKLDPTLEDLAQRVTVSPAGILVEGVNYQAAAMASVTQSQSLAFLEVHTATASGPMNSMAIATPKGMVLMAL